MKRRRKASSPRSPEQSRAHDTVDAILDAVVHVLVEGGAAGVTVQAIAKRAGVSPGSLYQYFATKDALIDACAAREMRRCLARLEVGIPALFSLPLREAAEAAIRGLVANLLLDEVLLSALLERQQSREEVAAFQDRAVNLIHLYLQGRPSNVPGADPEMTAFAVVHAVNAVIDATHRKRPDDLRSERLSNELVRMVIAYLAPWHGAERTSD